MAMHSQHVGLQQQEEEEAPFPTGHLPYIPAMSYVLPTPVIALSSALPQNLFCPMPVQFGPMLPPQQPHQFLQPASGQFTPVGQAMPGYNVVLPTVTSHPSIPMQCLPRPGQVLPSVQAALAPHELLSSAVPQAAQAAKAFFLSTNQLLNPGAPMPSSAYVYQTAFGPPTAIQPCGTAPRKTLPLVTPSMQPGQQPPSASASSHLERARERVKAAGKRRRHDGEKEEEQESPKVKLTPDYFLLDRIAYPEVSADDDDIIQIGTETTEGLYFGISLHVQEPPSISRLLLHSEVAIDVFEPHYKCNETLSISVITSSNKAILLCAEHKVNRCHFKDYFVFEYGLQSPVIRRLPMVGRLPDNGIGLYHRDGYYVVAALKMSFIRLPAMGPKSIYSVVCREPYISSFTTSSNEWTHRLVHFPPELKDWDWMTDMVLSCGGKFWWVDLSCGLLSCDCDPLPEQPTLNFTLLPNRSIQQTSQIESNAVVLLKKDCCVGFSNGLLRYVQLHRLKTCGSSVEMLTLNHGEWTKDCTLKFDDLWGDESYCSKGLPKEVPKCPVVDPFDPDVVYFSMQNIFDGCEFGIDLRAKLVKSCSSNYKSLGFYDYTLQPVFVVAHQSPLSIDSTAASSCLCTPTPCI